MCSGLTALEQHGAEAFVRLEQPDGWISIPKAQPCDLVLALEVRHANLEDRGGPVSAAGRRYPRAAHFVSIERLPEGKRPALLQIANDGRQAGEPI
jgi:hypothetical protein